MAEAWRSEELNASPSKFFQYLISVCIKIVKYELSTHSHPKDKKNILVD